MREVVPLVQLIVVELEERREGGKVREGREIGGRVGLQLPTSQNIHKCN